MYRHRQPTAAYRRMRPGRHRSWFWTVMVALPLLAFMIVFLWGGPPHA